MRKHDYVCAHCNAVRRHKRHLYARPVRPTVGGTIPVDAHLSRIRRENRAILAKMDNAQTGVREGFIYVITNPAWPGYVKVGRALDPIDRLNGYNTGDPTRRYKLEAYRYFSDRYEAERKAHRLLLPYWYGGEWFCVAVSEAIDVLERIHV